MISSLALPDGLRDGLCYLERGKKKGGRGWEKEEKEGGRGRKGEREDVERESGASGWMMTRLNTALRGGHLVSSIW